MIQKRFQILKKRSEYTSLLEAFHCGCQLLIYSPSSIKNTTTKNISFNQRVCACIRALVCVCVCVYVFSLIITLIKFLPIIIAKTLVIRHCGFCLFDIGWAVCDDLFVLGGVGPLAGWLTSQAGASCGEKVSCFTAACAK